MKKRIRIAVLATFLVLFCIFGLGAEALGSPTWGYSLDLPEDFVLSNREGNTRYLFQHSIQPVDLQIAIYKKGEFSNPTKTAQHIFSQLKMKHKDLPFIWHNKDAFLSMIEFEYAPSEKYKKKKLAGWVLVIELPDEKGQLAMLTYTDADKAKKCEPLMISSLDMVYTDVNSYFTPGPVTTALYPKKGEKTAQYNFAGKQIPFKYDVSDAEANKSVVDREFELLTIYLNRDSVFDAWKRYYRAIFRDAWSRILPFSLAIQMNFPELMDEEGINYEKTADLILRYVQSFKYVRDRKGSDFTNLPYAALAKEGDCDARSLLMVLMLKQMNIDAILLISPNKHHSVAAVDCASEGKTKEFFESSNDSYFPHIGKYYIMGETTTHTALGTLDARLKGDTEWFVVDFFINAVIPE